MAHLEIDRSPADPAVVEKMADVLALAAEHFIPGGGHRFEWAAVVFGDGERGTKFRIFTAVGQDENWYTLSVYGNVKFLDMKLSQAKAGQGDKAFDYDRLNACLSPGNARNAIDKYLRHTGKNMPGARQMAGYEDMLAHAISDGRAVTGVPSAGIPIVPAGTGAGEFAPAVIPGVDPNWSGDW